MESISNWSELFHTIIAGATVIMTTLYFAVIAPLKATIDQLSTATERIEKLVDTMDSRQRGMLERLAKMEESIKSAHHRIDEIRAGEAQGGEK